MSKAVPRFLISGSSRRDFAEEEPFLRPGIKEPYLLWSVHGWPIYSSGATE